MAFIQYTFGAVALVVIACLFQYFFVLGRWAHITSVERESFGSEATWTVYHQNDVKTTYYVPGKLGEIIPEWPHGQFHLFRVHPDHKYEFDTSLLNSEVVARELDYDCSGLSLNDCSRRSILTQNCLFDVNFTNGVVESFVDAASILTEGRGLHASFANMTNRNTVQNLWNELHLPFSLATTNFEHAFISNLKQDTITAAIHANPITDSMGVQLVGRKTWLFFPSDTYLSLMKSTFAGSALFPKRSPPAGSHPEVYVLTTYPGDVIFFPESWGHAVYTYEGPNLLMNFRQFYRGNFFRQPLTFVTSLVERMFRSNSLTKATDKKVLDQVKIVPQVEQNLRVMSMFKDMCDGGRSDFDRQMLDLMETEVSRIKGSK